MRLAHQLASLAAAFGLLAFVSMPANAQAIRQTKGDFEDKFRQLDEDLPTPTDVRPASGKPGPKYWQQKVGYKISVTLDETRKAISGSGKVTYKNNSPEALEYLWLHLDQNAFKSSMAEVSRTGGGTRGRDPLTPGRIGFAEVRRAQAMETFNGGFQIGAVSANGQPLKYTIVDTLLRIDLPRPLESGQSTQFDISWALNLIDTKLIGGRSGYECLTEKTEGGDCIYLMAQWFPRLAAFSDYEGWHNKAFLGSGEFTLEFGDYDVSITVPSDHIVSSTGELTNPQAVLSAQQIARLASARGAANPVFVVTREEALANEKAKDTGTKTWNFKARNVRDFAFASSRKFIWDAMEVQQPGAQPVLAMSFYPNEAEPLWSTYSTKSIAHTINVYSRYSFSYPYPTAQSVNGPVGGMEYPMITFNGPRPTLDADGSRSYSSRIKYGLIGVVIHEIGHIYFPMVVNSDERQWTWMDEGINSFLQVLAEREWEEDYPARRGEPKMITEYMRASDQNPIMTQSDSVLRFGENSYFKPAIALMILRETVMGRESFDHAFKLYSERWKFKRPTPTDFFRTMEEASGIDLDWFWRGWFYTTDHVDIAITRVSQSTIDTKDPRIESAYKKARRAEEPEALTQVRNREAGMVTWESKDPSIVDFYNETDPLDPTKREIEAYERYLKTLTEEERAQLQASTRVYQLDFQNVGGLVMPLILKLTWEDGTSEVRRIPAEIWRRSPKAIQWRLVSNKDLASVEVDPLLETADVDRNNNYFPPRIEKSRIELFKDPAASNPIRDNDLTVTPDSIKARPKPAKPAQ